MGLLDNMQQQQMPQGQGLLGQAPMPQQAQPQMPQQMQQMQQVMAQMKNASPQEKQMFMQKAAQNIRDPQVLQQIAQAIGMGQQQPMQPMQPMQQPMGG